MPAKCTRASTASAELGVSKMADATPASYSLSASRSVGVRPEWQIAATALGGAACLGVSRVESQDRARVSEPGAPLFESGKILRKNSLRRGQKSPSGLPCSPE